MILARISIARPVFAAMMMVAIMVLGVVSWLRLPVDLLPAVDLPAVVVTTRYEGASALTMEQQVTKTVEDAVGTIAGIKRVTSRSAPGYSAVFAEFNLDVSSRMAAEEIRERVSRLKGSLPKGADEPVVTRFNPQEAPILSLALNSPTATLTELTGFADRILVPRLRRVTGVGQVTVVGGSPSEIRVRPDMAVLSSFNIAVTDLIGRIQKATQDNAVGSIRSFTDERSVTLNVVPRDIAAFRDLVIGWDKSGRAIRLSEVAEIGETGGEPASRAWYNGAPTIGLDVVKVDGANTVSVSDGIRAEIERLKTDQSFAHLDVSVSQDSSRHIVEQIGDVEKTMLEGGLLTVVIVLVFLNSWRSTIITALTLPISVIGTFAAIAFMGFSLNILTMLALSICIGILIDDAIVVRENITRHADMGKDRKQAAIEGTSEIGLAVMATTLSIVAVFLPVGFMGGVIGRFFYQFGITVSVAVLISLFVSFTLDPMLSSVWPDPPKSERRGWLTRALDRFEQGFMRVARHYGDLIGWCLDHRWIVSFGVIGIFLLSLLIVPRIGTEFVPESDEGMVSVGLTLPEGSSSDYTAEKVHEAEALIRKLPDVQAIYSTVNGNEGSQTNTAQITITMVPAAQRQSTSMSFSPLVREALSTLAGVDVEVGRGGGDAQSKPVQVSILGEDMNVLERLADELSGRMRKVAGLTDLETSSAKRQPAVVIEPRMEALADFGVSADQLIGNLRPLVSGEKIASWGEPGARTRFVVLRLSEEDRRSVDDLKNLRIPASPGADGMPRMVRLSQLAEIREETAPQAIYRRDSDREVRVSANITDRPMGAVITDVTTLTTTTALPPGYRITIGGEAEDLAESFGHAVQALMLAVVFIYLILASQFNSFVQPLAIMTSLPLSLIGVLLGLLMTGSTLNLFSIIGFITLMGLVTKNAILLVDHANTLAGEGAGMRESLIEAGKVRLRPIIMTTVAMIVGMLPLAIGMGERASMAHAIIGGLVSSTALTLLFVPVSISLMNSLRVRLSRWSSRK